MAEQTAPAYGPHNVPLGDKPYSSEFTSLGLETAENLFVEKSTTETALSAYYYVSIPGMKNYILESSPASAACRGLYTTGTGKVFGAWSNQLFEIFSNGDRSFVGQLLSFSGPISFADNSFEMILVDGMAGYTVNLTTGAFAQILDEYFPGIADNDNTKAPSKVCMIDSYFLVNKQNSNEYYWSTPNYVDTAFDMDNPTKTNKWNGLQFGIKLGDSDEIIGMTKNVSLLYLFGRQSIEIHYNTGDYTNQLFSRMSNALINFGCSAPNSIAQFANSVYWIGTDRSSGGTIGIFTSSNDFMPSRISTKGIESIMADMSTSEDALSYVYSQEGNTFITWYFPSGGKTLVYDVSTGAWHTRTHYDYVTGIKSAYYGLYTTAGFGKILIGDRLGDAVYVLDPNQYYNNNSDGVGVNYIRREKTTPINFNMARMVRYKSLQLLMQQGVGLNVGFTDNTSRTEFKNYYNSLGVACPNGTAYFYKAGTTILQDTYNQITGGVVKSNPVVLDGNGLATVFLQPLAYDVVIRNPDNSVFLELKNIGTIPVGYDPKAMISWSNDSGKSWSNEREIALGKLGEFNKRSRMTLLGAGRNRVWKIVITEPVQVVIAGLLVDWDGLAR
jgi:hypothetical protein